MVFLAAFTIWQADALLGPCEMVENLVNPSGHKAGDFDMIKDAETGKAYLYFDADHNAMLCMELSDDYLRAKDLPVPCLETCQVLLL